MGIIKFLRMFFFFLSFNYVTAFISDEGELGAFVQAPVTEFVY